MPETKTTRFVLHTKLSPDAATEPAPQAEKKWQVLRHPKAALSIGEKLLLNSAIACALLLGILGIGAVDAPWADNMTRGIEDAFTTSVDLDDSLWSLAFMGELLPESVQAFFGMETGRFTMPADGETVHAWSENQPWLAIECGAGAEVRAALSGTVTAVCTLSDGNIGVLIDHGSGVETVYASLRDASFDPADAVERGEVIGSAADGGVVFFEMRRDSASVNPAGEAE